jgi:predicted nuclease of restriction endonuclease-like RecB superfamily
MLPSNMLITRKRGDRIRPVFAERTSDNLALLENVINLFSKSVGRRYSHLSEEFQMLEESYEVDYRFLRSLFMLLERKIVLEKPPVDPFRLRQKVFEIADRRPVTSEEEREAVFEKASLELGISREELEESLWIDEDPVVKEFTSLTSDELLDLYNLSLFQTLLFKADVLEISLPNPDMTFLKNLLRQLRFYGLMYDIWKSGDEINLTIDGPISILKSTKKYGVAMAKFIPSVLNARDWSLKCRILDKKRVFEFQLDEREFSRYYRKDVEETTKPVFDSVVEERFYRRFNSLKSGWILRREPEPLIRDSVVMFPDFCFEGYNQRIFMEIVGFWTPEYLKKKMVKLKPFPKLVVCIDEGLRCSPQLRLPSGLVNVVFYRKAIPLNKILAILKPYETVELDREFKIIDNRFKKPASAVVTVDEICSELGVSSTAIKKFLEKGVGGYVFTGHLLVSEELMDNISRKIDRIVGVGTYRQALDIIKESIPSRQEEVFNAMGYTVDWKSLDVEDAVIKKKSY